YGPLLSEPEAGDADAWRDDLNPDSLVVRKGAKLEPLLADATPDHTYQFERIGYFCRDAESEGLVFNQSVPLRDSWK
ncbi:MAG: glutamine--tRNA ligase, partial [Phycisphaeraceae bacterium]|nr:glutamine--tRNA ligase [Phycisphaeraceae bacterium]